MDVELMMIADCLADAITALEDGDLSAAVSELEDAEMYLHNYQMRLPEVDPPKPTGESKQKRRQPTPNGESHARNKN